jgi:hypothetical protein
MDKTIKDLIAENEAIAEERDRLRGKSEVFQKSTIEFAEKVERLTAALEEARGAIRKALVEMAEGAYPDAQEILYTVLKVAAEKELSEALTDKGKPEGERPSKISPEEVEDMIEEGRKRGNELRERLEPMFRDVPMNLRLDSADKSNPDPPCEMCPTCKEQLRPDGVCPSRCDLRPDPPYEMCGGSGEIETWTRPTGLTTQQQAEGPWKYPCPKGCKPPSCNPKGKEGER